MASPRADASHPMRSDTRARPVEPRPDRAHGRLDELADFYDAIVVGGGLAGSAFALLLARWRPDARILVVERSRCFERKVGEATVEVSGIFLHRILGLYDHLSRHHLPKHGLRYWFGDGAKRGLREMTEVGPFEMPQLPSFQLDRPILDGHVLATAEAEGCDVLRPAKVVSVELGWPESRITLRDLDPAANSGGSGGEKGAARERTLRTRWLVDASGRQAFLARKLGLYRLEERHSTAAVWARWRGARDLDGPDALGDDPRAPWLRPISASRRLATNHFCGYGWWSWVIPLADGQTSIGVVYDKNLYSLPGEGTLKDRYLAFVRSTDGLRELVEHGEMETDGQGRHDLMALSHLPYRSERYMDRGWALVADAASFLDPYYSPGLDHAAMSIYATARIVEKDLAARAAGQPLSESALESLVDRHNGAFERSYDRWLEALYLGKYELLGDAELVRCAFLVDTALYYLGVVTPIHGDLEALGNPVFGVDLPQATFAYRLTRAFNRRLLTLARFRRKAGLYGRRNLGKKHYSKAFGIGLGAALRPLRAGLAIWLRLEIEKLLHRSNRGPMDLSSPVPDPATERRAPRSAPSVVSAGAARASR